MAILYRDEDGVLHLSRYFIYLRFIQKLKKKHAFHLWRGRRMPHINNSYHMASSASCQDKSNPVLWLATRAGKMELSCSLGITRRVPQEKFLWKPYNKSFIDQACLVKMAGYWPRSFFASLWTLTASRSIYTQKKNLANIQPSWPHTWSITHTSRQIYWLNSCWYFF